MSYKIVEMGAAASGLEEIGPLLDFELLDDFTRSSEAALVDFRSNDVFERSTLAEALAPPGTAVVDTSTLTPGPAPATVTPGQADPAGGTAAIKIEDTSAAQVQVARTTPAPYNVSDVPFWISFWLKKDAAATGFMAIELLVAGGLRVELRIDPTNGDLLTFLAPVGTTTPHIQELAGWFFISFRWPGLGIPTPPKTFTVQIVPTFGITFPAPTTPTAVGAITIYNIHVVDETIDGLSNPAPWLVIDEPAIFQDGAIRIERPSTNIVTASEALDDAAWNPLNGPTVTADVGIAPDVGPDADDLTHSANALSQIEQLTAPGATVDNGPAALSVWSQAASGSNNWRLGVVDRAGVQGTLDPKTAITTYARAISLIGDVGAGANGVKIQLVNELAGGIKTVRHSGAMIEAAEFVSSYIRTPTGSTATRGNENARFDAGKWQPLKRRNFEANVSPGWSETNTPVSGTRHVVFHGSEADDFLDFRFNGTAWELRYSEKGPPVRSSIVTFATTFGLGDRLTIQALRSTDKIRVSINGGGFIDGTTAANPFVGWATSTGQLFVGQDTLGGSHFDGILERPLRI